MDPKSYVDAQGHEHTGPKMSRQKIGNTWIEVPACWRLDEKGNKQKVKRPTPHAKTIAALLKRTVAR